MTVQVDIFTLMIFLLLVIVMAFLLPMIWQVKKTGKEADALLGELRRELIPTLRELREIAERFNRASVTIEQGADKAENLLESLNEMSDTVRHVSKFLRQDVCSFAENISCLMLGVRVAGKAFLKGIQEKGG
jgi:methyl-accepting chemotaxis protein